MNAERKEFLLIINHPAQGDWNMAVDEVLMSAAESAAALPVLRLYGWQPACLSLGQGQKYADVDLDAVKQNGWQVVRRPTGGKAILHTDELTYSLTAHEDHWLMQGGILASYQRISKVLLTFLHLLQIPGASQTPETPASPQGLGPVCFEVPSSYEITVNGTKIIGSAQARKNHAVLQHGSIPLAGDITRITQALRYPDAAARLAAAEKVRRRAGTVEELSATTPDWHNCAALMQQAFWETYQITFTPISFTTDQLETINNLAANKYGSLDWTARL